MGPQEAEILGFGTLPKQDQGMFFHALPMYAATTSPALVANGPSERSENVVRILLVVAGVLVAGGVFIGAMAGLAKVMQFIEDNHPAILFGLGIGSIAGLVLSYIFASAALAWACGAVLAALIWWEVQGHV